MIWNPKEWSDISSADQSRNSFVPKQLLALEEKEEEIKDYWMSTLLKERSLVRRDKMKVLHKTLNKGL